MSAWKYFFVFLFPLVVLFGCQGELEDSSVSVDPMLTAAPAPFCPGEDVTVAWDLSARSSSPDHCVPNGGFSRLMSCSADSECPSGGGCVDGICCSASVIPLGLCPKLDGGSCKKFFSLSVRNSEGLISPPVERISIPERGSRTVTPSGDITFSADGFVLPGGQPIGPSSAAATAVTGYLSETLVLRFACSGATPGWVPVNTESRFLNASARLRVVGVRNVGGRDSMLGAQHDGGPTVPAVTIPRGGISDRFNGLPPGNIWTGSVTPGDRFGFSPQPCGSVQGGSPWPNVAVEVTYACQNGQQ